MVFVFMIIAPWLLIFLAVVMVIGNGIIMLVVAKNSALRQTDCLYLIAALAAADFFTGLGTLPYCTNMITHDYAFCSRGSVMGTMVGNIVGVRMSQFITLFIGFDRLYALFYPIVYRAKDHITIAKFITVAGILMGCVDVVLYLIESDLKTVMSTCNLLIVLGPKSRAYRFITDLILNIGTQIVYAFVYYKIRQIKNDQTIDMSRDQFRQANHTVSLLLFSSLIFLTIPSLVNMYDYIMNLGIFKVCGPLLSIGICINGGFNIFIYHLAHKDFNEAIRALFGFQKNVIHPKEQIEL